MDLHKLSPQLVRLLQTDVDPHTPTEVLIKSQSRLEEAQLDQLKALDVHLSTVSGRIISATLPLAAIAPLTTLDFIRYIETATPLYLETPPPYPPDEADSHLNDPPFLKDDLYE